MQVLTATTETQGQRDDDFSWTVDGELVCFPFDDCPDCGCDRAFAGLASARATTTARVLDHPGLSPATYRLALHDALVRQGFVQAGDPGDDAFVAELSRRQLEAAAALPDGAVVELHEGRLHVRTGVR